MIFGAVGNQRAGKTLGCVAWALWFAERTNQKISTNLRLNIPDTVQWETWQEMVKKTPNNCIIIFDEIDTAIDSRNFKSEDQMAFTHWFKQLGKRGITFFYTTQRMHMVEKRVREQTDYTIMCTKNWLTGKLSEQWFDTQAGMDNAICVKSFVIDNPSLIYPLYDSFQTVATTMIGAKPKYARYK